MSSYSRHHQALLVGRQEIAAQRMPRAGRPVDWSNVSHSLGVVGRQAFEAIVTFGREAPLGDATTS